MIGVLRVVGFLLIGAGAIVLITWAFEPLRAIWPWFLSLPMPVQIGLAIAALGFLVLMGTVLYERFQDRGQDASLRDEF